MIIVEFSTAPNLKQHKNSVCNGQKEHKCDSCGKSFSQVGNLKSHINYVHKYDQKDNKCGSCEKAFTQVGDLKKHISHSSYWSKRS